MPRNVRLKSGSGAFRTGRELAKETPSVKKKATGPALEREAEALRHRIERLEYVVSMADSIADSAPAAGSRRRRPHARRERERRQALVLAFQFFLMALVIAAALGWLNQRFHFFG